MSRYTEFEQDVARYQKAALTEPVVITENGVDTTVLLSVATLRILARGRLAERMEELDEQSLNELAAAEVPAECAYLDKLDLS